MMNGDEIRVQHGDKVISLEERLTLQDRDIDRIQKVLLIGGVVLLFHAVLPQEALLQLFIGLIGL